MFNSTRLKVARHRARLTKAQLATLAGVSARTITGFEAGEYEPSSETQVKLSQALHFPTEFFEGDDLEIVDARGVSFRSLTKMTAKQRDASIAAGSLAYLLSDWVDSNFDLPDVSIPNLGGVPPATAAASLRQIWSLGEAPIANMLDLVELKGIRVFSLMESGAEVDAYSMWRGTRPFIFVNTGKSGERRRFDVAHELGHLVLHREGAPNGIDAEREANEFAGAFLMPESGLRAVGRLPNTLEGYFPLKRVWGVSLGALLYRLHETRLITYYVFNRLFVELSRRGYRAEEPSPMKVEVSQVWQKVLENLRADGQGIPYLSDELTVPQNEIAKLLFGLATVPMVSDASTTPKSRSRATLRVVK